MSKKYETIEGDSKVIIKLKNELNDALDKMADYEAKLELQEILVESYDKKLDEAERLHVIMKESLSQKDKQLKEKKQYETVRSVDYWKGIEKAYIDKLDEYLERIIALEKRNFFLEVENEELKNMNHQP